MIKNLSLSVMPLFACNCNCSYCYLGTRRKDQSILSINDLINRLNELKQHSIEISSIDVYGGNLDLLQIDYLKNILCICKDSCEKVNVVANVDKNLNVASLANSLNCAIGISVNDDRIINEKVFDALEHISYDNAFYKKIDILCVCLHSLIQTDLPKFLQRLNTYSCVKSLAILQYSASIRNPNRYSISNKELASFLIKIHNEFLINKYSFSLRLPQQSSPFEKHHMYIMPSGRFAYLKYDENGLEDFSEVSSIEEFYFTTIKELLKFSQCSTCKYNQLCFAEHLKMHNADDICCGLPTAIEVINAKRSSNYTTTCN